MEDTVRDILASRTVRLEPVSETFQIYGFRCLGIAEKILDLDSTDSSPVYVWHVQDDILPLSKNEIERWSVDAPGSRHWILSEREFNENIFDDISVDFKVDAWGPEKLSGWIGQAVLRGDLKVNSGPTKNSPESLIKDIHNEKPQNSDVITLMPLIEINTWLDTESLSMLNTLPVLINAKLWDVSGVIFGPNSIKETKSWSFIEDPWSTKIYQFDNDDVLNDSPDLRKIDPVDGNWQTIESLKLKLKPLLDFRKKEKTFEANEKVKSIMLEWWRVDLETLSLESHHAQIPGWILIFEDGQKKILHSRNGKTYNFRD
jgi:hypothetical protein